MLLAVATLVNVAQRSILLADGNKKKNREKNIWWRQNGEESQNIYKYAAELFCFLVCLRILKKISVQYIHLSYLFFCIEKRRRKKRECLWLLVNIYADFEEGMKWKNWVPGCWKTTWFIEHQTLKCFIHFAVKTIDVTNFLTIFFFYYYYHYFIPSLLFVYYMLSFLFHYIIFLIAFAFDLHYSVKLLFDMLLV